MKTLDGKDLYVDPQFPIKPYLASIFQNAADNEKRFEIFEWKRPDKLCLITNDEAEVDFNLDTLCSEDIDSIFDDDNFNSLGNYAFISAISALAQHRKYIDDMFVTKVNNLKGVYAMQYYMDGE